MTAIEITTLEASGEALVRQQVAEYEAQLRAALGRRLSPAASPSSRRRSGRQKASAKRASKALPRRSAEELSALAEQFFEAVEATPGETMAALAARLELSSRALERLVQRLEHEGRIKTVGERNRTRYHARTRRPEQVVQAVAKSEGAGSPSVRVAQATKNAKTSRPCFCAVCAMVIRRSANWLPWSLWECNRERLRYGAFREARLAIGSGAVELSVRRVVNLRLKGSSIVWTEAHAEGVIHLCAHAKSGRWAEIEAAVLADTGWKPTARRLPRAGPLRLWIIAP